MIIIDPVALADTSFTGGGGTYWDRNGVLQDAVANVLRVTYDPTDLSKAPYALVEPAATNLLLYSEKFDNAAWLKGNALISPDVAVAPDGSMTADKWIEDIAPYHSIGQSIAFVSGTTYTVSFFVKAAERQECILGFDPGAFGTYQYAKFNLATGTGVAFLGAPQFSIKAHANGWFRISVTATASITITANVWSIQLYNGSNGYAGDGSSGMYVWGSQLESNTYASSYIRRSNGSGVRIADVIGATAGLVYSNVAITEPDYNPATSYANGVYVHDPATHLTYQSNVTANIGNALTDTTKWTKRDVTNRWKMLDQYNNTQTSSADEILIVLSPKTISQGLYLGNLDANDIRASVVDLTEGLVYRETQSQLVSDSGNSFFNWFFKRIRRKTYAVSVMLPAYCNALVTIAIRKDGGTAKCGMAVVGPLVDAGLSICGLSTEIKDYSTTRFNFDGTSETTLRGYSKLMSIDLILDNAAIDAVQEQLAEFRQKNIVYLGEVMYGSTCLFGKFSSMKNVIQYSTESQMSVQIQGVV